MVRATGIVSIAAHLHGQTMLGLALLWLNAAAWVALVLLSMLRMARCPKRFFGDMADHLCGISGGWLLAVVATPSLAVLGALLAGQAHARWRPELNFLALSTWLFGGMLYIWIMSLIFYRYTSFAVSPGDLTPPYWISMGAMAISTLAGSLLVANAAHGAVPAFDPAFPQGVHDFLLGDRDLVATDAPAARLMALRLQALPAEVRPAVLGRGVPAWHVFRQHPRDDAHHSARFPAVPRAAFPLRRARGRAATFLALASQTLRCEWRRA
jgi:hypothetical protein